MPVSSAPLTAEMCDCSEGVMDGHEGHWGGGRDVAADPIWQPWGRYLIVLRYLGLSMFIHIVVLVHWLSKAGTLIHLMKYNRFLTIPVRLETKICNTKVIHFHAASTNALTPKSSAAKVSCRPAYRHIISALRTLITTEWNSEKCESQLKQFCGTSSWASHWSGWSQKLLIGQIGTRSWDSDWLSKSLENNNINMWWQDRRKIASCSVSRDPPNLD